MTTGESIKFSCIFPCEKFGYFSPVLGYSPSKNFCFCICNAQFMAVMYIDPAIAVLRQLITPDVTISKTAALFSYVDYTLLAVDDFRLPAQIRIFRLPNDSTASNDVTSSVYIKPDFGEEKITSLRFFPDGSRIIAACTCTSSKSYKGPWYKIFTVEGLWDESTDGNRESPSGDTKRIRNNKLLVCEEIDVFQQGFALPDERVERMNNPETDDDYLLCEKLHLASNRRGGFYSLAISPDTLRILAGTNDGEVYIIETASQKVLQSIRAYDYYDTVTGCHYSPVFGHQEFATCDETGMFDIWRIEELDNGAEEAGRVHHLRFIPGTSSCTYSPDGKLIAVTSARVFETYIVSSQSGETVYTLEYIEDFIDYQIYFTNSSSFIGHLCHVATLHCDHTLCIWKLPVVYSLKTMCFLVIRSAVKYNSIENLSLPIPLKSQLKYLYV